MRRKGPPWLCAAVAIALAGTACAWGCGPGLAGSYEDALGRWRDGEWDGAIARARAAYEKFRAANGLAAADIEQALAAGLERLESTPLPPRAAPVVDLDAVDLVRTGTSGLVLALRADLLSDEVTAILRGLQTVETWSLESEAPLVLHVVFDHRPIRSASALLADATPALRALAVKRGALDVLGRLVLARARGSVL